MEAGECNDDGSPFTVHRNHLLQPGGELDALLSLDLVQLHKKVKDKRFIFPPAL